MKHAPTLADALIRELQKPLYRRSKRYAALASNIASARKFMLDDNMSAFMADLAYASLLTCRNTDKAHMLMNGMRQMARLPHDLIWIEYNFHAKAHRAVHEYGAQISLDPAMIPDRNGWLCWRHPEVDNAFMAMECASHSFSAKGVKEPVPNGTPFCYAWRTDDGPLPWKRLPIPGRDHPEGHLTGIMSYRCASVGVVHAPQFPEDFLLQYMKESRYDPLIELSSDLRYLWALLATINDLPTKTVTVQATKGYIARGRYHKFVDHSVIHLTVPVKAYRRVAGRAIAIARRRAHQVRGHWRKHWQHRPAAFCEHIWKTEGSKMECSLCGGQRLWIHQHQRGDANLGFVTHDYTVEHPND